MLRRVVVGASGARLWQLLGYVGPEDEQETFDEVELFQGIGFASRPGAGKGEVIVGHMGARAGHPVGIASRDTSTTPALEPDETAIYNSLCAVKCDEDGNVSAVPDVAGKVLLGSLTAAQEAVRGTIYRNAEATYNGAVAAAMTTIAAAMTKLETIGALSAASTELTAAATAALAAATAEGVFEAGAVVYLSDNVNVK
jgi:phage gp45-like